MALALPRWARNGTVLALGLVLLIAAFVGGWLLLPVQEGIADFTAWIHRLGAWGFVLFGLVYALAVVVFAPAGALSLAAGFLFGASGFPLVVCAATLGAALAFSISRYVAREKVRDWAQSQPTFDALYAAVREEGWKLVVLLRLNPLVPFNLQNYVFGATEIGFRPFALGTFFGIMPGTALYVSLGALGQAAVGGEDQTTLRVALLVAGLAATAATVFVVGRKAKAKLRGAGLADPRVAAADRLSP